MIQNKISRPIEEFAISQNLRKENLNLEEEKKSEIAATFAAFKKILPER